MVKIAINGFGRIGRATLRSFLEKDKGEVVAINDLTDSQTLAHLLKHDSVFGNYKEKVGFDKGHLIVNNKKIKAFQERDPEKLPWKELGVDVVLECTGIFRDYEGAKKHLLAGAKKVIISATSKDPDKVPSIVIGVNDSDIEIQNYDIFDMASCTTNCLAPIIKILHYNIGIEKGLMTTVHAYTTTQNILDGPHKDLRRARAAAVNIVPTTTGAAKAIGYVIPELAGKIDGMALRVPVPNVSIVDFVCSLKKDTSVEKINNIFKKESLKEEWKNILACEEKPLVSSDYIGNSHSSIVDLPSTRVFGNMVKILAWYDNEFGYASRLTDFGQYLGEKI